jgi:UDP-N-acetylmuramate--alanine ligase
MRIHVVGIGGMGMSAVARILLARGHIVSGSDDGAWPLAEALARDGATVYRSFDAAHVKRVDVVLRSSAYGETNPEIRAALDAGVLVWKRDDAWRELSRGERVIAIAGTHGKTTTTAMTWTALRAGGVDASLICGAPLRDIGTNAYSGRDRTLVIEADEYDRAFLALHPDIAVVTNVDHDHVDIFPSRGDYATAFTQFASQVQGTLVACWDDPGAQALATAVRARGGPVRTYGNAEGADLRVYGRADPLAMLEIIRPDTLKKKEREFARERRLQVLGWHNALNAAGAVIAADTAGVPADTALDAISRFPGTARRMEILGKERGVLVVDDYAHHPSEIEAGKVAFSESPERLIIVFQPHTPSRLSAFFDEFVESLRYTDGVVIVETFSSARETNEGPSDAKRLADTLGADYATTIDEAVEAAYRIVKEGDIVIVMGAGDVRPVGEQLLKRLRQGTTA